MTDLPYTPHCNQRFGDFLVGAIAEQLGRQLSRQEVLRQRFHCQVSVSTLSYPCEEGWA